jgi:PAS domain-containing protein
MGSEEREDEQLRSVAFENARSILHARQRAERELLLTKEALEQKTQELASSLALLRATLESTFDGILVTDGEGQVTGFNEKFVRMWDIARDTLAMGNHRTLEQCAAQLLGSQDYLARLEQIYTASPPESIDVLELTDGRVYERFSSIQFVDGQNIGRVWTFRDITAQKLNTAS